MYLHTKFHVLASNVSTGIAIKQKINYIFCAKTQLLYCILQITLRHNNNNNNNNNLLH